AAEAQRQAARGPRCVRGGVEGQGAAGHVVPRAHEEAPRVIQGTVGAAGSSSYVEVTVDVGDEAAEALTNFLWEQGAVGVVEETLLAGPARLRAFFPVTASTDALAVRVDAYVAGLRA